MLCRFLTLGSPPFLSEVSEEPHGNALGPEHGQSHWLKQPWWVSKATKRRGLGAQDILFGPDTCASSAIKGHYHDLNDGGCGCPVANQRWQL